MSWRPFFASLACFVAGIGLGHSAHRFGVSEQNETSAAPKLSSIQFLSLAIASEPDHADRADVLAQAAIQHLAHDPDSLPAFWAAFEKFRNNRNDLSPDDLLSRLLIIEGAAEAAIAECRTERQLDTVWRVQERVAESLRDARNDTFAKVASEVQRFMSKQATAPNDWIAEFVTVRPKWERRLSGALASPPTAPQQESLRLIGESAKALQEWALAQIQALENESGAGVNANSAREIQPTKQGVPGELQKRMEQLVGIVQSLEAADLDGWQRFLATASAPSTMVNLEGQLEATAINKASRLLARVGSLQQLRYNLWAVNQLAAAQTSDNWDVFLSRIEVGLLEPPTATLYGMVYDKRIREVADAKMQADTVGRILRSDKALLSQF
jgi:hypothetical protein